MKISAVIGSNYGDEGKGLVSGWLAKQSIGRTVTVLFNGGVQRGHTVYDHNGERHIVHTVGAGHWTNDMHVTYYHENFMVDPIALALEKSSVYMDPNCRIVLPCDVLANRQLESSRGALRHGSCGMGIYQCFSRSKKPEVCITAKNLFDFDLYSRLKAMTDNEDQLYNVDNFMKAVDFVKKYCIIQPFDTFLGDYEDADFIFEGGQGLLLDMDNKADFPHLTPSKTGVAGIIPVLDTMANISEVNLYYVSRGYITRHGNGPLEGKELDPNDIQPGLRDLTNEPNEWQGSIRYGTINKTKLANRILFDRAGLEKEPVTNIVFTHMNVTNDSVLFTDGALPIDQLNPADFKCNHIYTSHNETSIELLR